MNEAGLRSSADGISCELLSMPHEVLLNILSFLDAKDLCILCFVSTELRGLAEDDAPWTSLWHSKFPPLLLLSHKHGNLTQFNLCIYSHSRALAHLQREFPSRKLMYRERILTRQRWSKRPRVVAYSLHETLLRTLQVTVKWSFYHSNFLLFQYDEEKCYTASDVGVEEICCWPMADLLRFQEEDADQNESQTQPPNPIVQSQIKVNWFPYTSHPNQTNPFPSETSRPSIR